MNINESGLTDEQVVAQRKKYGTNDINCKKKNSFLVNLGEFFSCLVGQKDKDVINVFRKYKGLTKYIVPAVISLGLMALSPHVGSFIYVTLPLGLIGTITTATANMDFTKKKARSFSQAVLLAVKTLPPSLKPTDTTSICRKIGRIYCHAEQVFTGGKAQTNVKTTTQVTMYSA